MAATTIDLDSLLEVREGFRSGRPCIAGTGVTVHTIVEHHALGMSIAEIHEAFPQTSLAGIHAALAYYFANRGEIECDFAEDDRMIEEARGMPGVEFVEL